MTGCQPSNFGRMSRPRNQTKTKQNRRKRNKMKSNIMKRAVALLAALARQRWIRSVETLRQKRGRSVCLANVAEGTHDGNITKAVDASITERYLLAKIGSASDRVAVCGAADTPIGVITDEAAAIGDLVNISLIGCAGRTVRMVASAAIAQGALIEPAANGRVATLGAGAGTHHVVGRALDAASSAGDVIEVAPYYFLRVI
jgi:hypothetical protein